MVNPPSPLPLLPLLYSLRCNVLYKHIVWVGLLLHRNWILSDKIFKTRVRLQLQTIQFSLAEKEGKPVNLTSLWVSNHAVRFKASHSDCSLPALHGFVLPSYSVNLVVQICLRTFRAHEIAWLTYPRDGDYS